MYFLPTFRGLGHNLVHTVDDIILRYLKDPKLWELWYIPSYG